MSMTIVDRKELERALTLLDRAAQANPDVRSAADSLRRALDSSAVKQLLTTKEAANALGIRSVNTIKHWIKIGYIRGVQRNERLMIPIEEVERIQHDDQVRDLRAAARLEDDIAELGLDRDLTQDELDSISQARPGQLPWTKTTAEAGAL